MGARLPTPRTSPAVLPIGTVHGRDELLAHVSRAMTLFDRTVHLGTNAAIEIDGDRATSRGAQRHPHSWRTAPTRTASGGPGAAAPGADRGTAENRSVLAGRRTTCLPKYMERSAYLATSWRLGRYYRTYPAYVEDEVKAALDDPAAQFVRGPRTLTARGTAADDTPAFVVQDGTYLSARWPGDAYLFGRRFQTEHSAGYRRSVRRHRAALGPTERTERIHATSLAHRTGPGALRAR